MKYAGFALAVAGLVACSVYDAPMPRVPEAGTASGSSGDGTAGSSGTGAAGRAAGAGGSTGGSNAGASGAAGAAGAAGTTGTAGAAGMAADPSCGNGRIDGAEHCDTGIAGGMPGACPTSCPATDACRRGALRGSGCGTECVVTELGCADGDGCCPASCNPSSDGDCSGGCGDGLVQAERGETCDPSSETTRCPTLAECADADPCTLDAMRGGAATCDAACTHTAITAAVGGDGCCPPGANATSDGDCQPRCGNGVREGSEACDGATGCDASCTQTLSATQLQCLDTLAETGCDRCECTRCTTAMLACRGSGNAARDQACTAVARCALEQNCAGTACYCGTASTSFACAFGANGACKRVIEEAAGTTSPNRILSLANDASSVLGRAIALGDCRRAQCGSDCR